MVQPINYAQLVGGFQSPQEAFANTIKLREYYLQQQKAAEDARLAKEKAAQMNADLQDYTTAPTPQKLANLHLNYPSLKESLNAYTQTLSDADRKTTTEFATQAFGLNRAGKTDQVLSLFDTYIKAATDSGRPDMAKALTDSKSTFSVIEDPAAREALIGSVLASTGKEGLDLYDKIWASNLDLDTSVIKNIVALGYKPGTPEFQAELRKQMDKITITRPDGTFIQGTPEEIRDVLGQGGGKVLPRVSTLEEARKLPPGTRFIGPDGNPYEVPAKGGQTEKPSGTFQGQ
jgi:ABC-type Fe3+ transport system substrate-binding protein